MSSLKQSQQQKLKLSVKQVLHANLLQLNAQLLEQRILKEISENPVLELSEEEPDPEESRDNAQEESAEQDNIAELDEKKDETDFEWEELLGEHEEYENPPTNNSEEKTYEIPIISKENLNVKPDCLLVLAWNFFDEIKKKNSDLSHKFISIKELEN